MRTEQIYGARQQVYPAAASRAVFFRAGRMRRRNNAEYAIKLPRMIVLQRRLESPRAGPCKDETARQARGVHVWRALRLLTAPEGA